MFQTPARPQAVPVPSSSSSKPLHSRVFSRLSAEGSSSLTIALEMGTAKKVSPGVSTSVTCAQMQMSNGKSAVAQERLLSPKTSFNAVSPERQLGLCPSRAVMFYLHCSVCKRPEIPPLNH